MKHTTDRIIVVLDYGNIRGGLEKVAIESALELKKAGKDVVFFCGVAPLDDRLEKSGIQTICLGLEDIASNTSRLEAVKLGLWNSAAAKKLNSVIRDTDNLEGTVVHVHGWTKSLSSAIGPVVTAPGIRHVFTMHEYFFACPNGGFFDYQKNEICHRKAMSASCLATNCDIRSPSHKAFRVVRQAVQRGPGGLPSKTRNIIYISQLQKTVLRPYFRDQTRFFHVENPAVSVKQDAVDVASNQDFYFVGRLVGAKGALEFASAAQKAGVRAVFIGDGPLRDDIMKVNPAAQVLGWQSPDDVAKLLRKARALAFPSLWYETIGLVPIEALALGIPVICGDWSAARESVVHEETGLLINSEDFEGSFADALRRLDDTSYIAKLGQQAYHRYWERPLTLERHISRLLEVYDEI